MRLTFTSLLIVSCIVLPSHGAEVVQLTEKNWDEYAPLGKEVDAIYGDYVLRNDKIIAVIANPIEGRNANLSTKDVGGCIIDLTTRKNPNDQLTAIYPLARKFAYRSAEIVKGSGKRAVLVCRGTEIQGQLSAEVRYVLEDGADDLRIETDVTNPSSQPAKVKLADDVRADKTFQRGVSAERSMVWVEDVWFGQAYGFLSVDAANPVEFEKSDRPTVVSYGDEKEQNRTLDASGKVSFSRRVICAAYSLDLWTIAGRMRGKQDPLVQLVVAGPIGSVEGAEIEVQLTATQVLHGRTSLEGTCSFFLPLGEYPVKISSIGCTGQVFRLKVEGETKHRFTMDAPGYIAAKITNEKGKPIPCKVQFFGLEGTPDPFFGPEGADHGVQNCYYSHDGKFRQAISPGKYRVIVSHGPEYDAVFSEIQVERGKDVELMAKLIRVVDTAGWISADFHSHSSPSGDNTSSQRGRVLNLLAEHIEFAPCTEHNRIDSYTPHIKALGVERLMATATGIELTGQPLPLNHQNAFPLLHKPHTQDGGGPQTADPGAQIERLALWDDKADKLVQQNHPNIVQLVFDGDLDGKPDEAYAKALPYMDVIEVHPLENILQPASLKDGVNLGKNAIHGWLQLLNQGHRVPGVVNTDAHYNFHGSGGMRNYVKSLTDEPEKIKTLDVVHESEKGHIVMSTGPFMEVYAKIPNVRSQPPRWLPGDVLELKQNSVELQVSVQCPNWLDIDRVQIFRNGRPDPKLNFTRKSNPEMFSDNVVKFSQEILLDFKEDTHVIVVAVGKNFKLGPVMGGYNADNLPIAVSNPIYVDVDGGGFKANGDTLDAPLPLRDK